MDKLVILAVVANLAGCATILSKGFGSTGHVYSGTSCDGLFVYGLFSNENKADKYMKKEMYKILPFVVLDIPLSLVADTVYLPIDLIYYEPDWNPTCLGGG